MELLEEVVSATSFLLQKINEYSVYMYQSKADQDFLHTVTVSTPLTHLDFKGNSKKDTLTHLLLNIHQWNIYSYFKFTRNSLFFY